MNNGRGVYSAIFRFYEIQQTLQNQENRSDGLHRQTLNVLPSKKIGVASDLPNQVMTVLLYQLLVIAGKQ
jgi:hypothetical protein